jgi:hypothetical protein
MMKTDSEIRTEGIQVLRQHLGVVDAGRFIALINRACFDYTHWRQGQWDGETVVSLAAKARKLREDGFVC